MSAPVFRTSGIDPRRLNQPAHEIGRQTHGERLRVHGPIQPGLAPPRPERIVIRTRPSSSRACRGAVQAFAESLVRGLAIAISAFCLVYFAAELARPILERIF